METESITGLGKHGLLHMRGGTRIFQKGKQRSRFFIFFEKKQRVSPQAVWGGAI